MLNGKQVNADTSSSPPSSLQQIPSWLLSLSSIETTPIKVTCDFHSTKSSGQLLAEFDRRSFFLPRYPLFLHIQNITPPPVCFLQVNIADWSSSWPLLSNPGFSPDSSLRSTTDSLSEFWSYSFKFELYTDDSQIYIFSPDSSPKVQTHISRSLPGISIWMSRSCLKHKMSQTDLTHKTCTIHSLFHLNLLQFHHFSGSGRKLGSHPWPFSFSYVSHSIHQEILLALLPKCIWIKFLLTTPTATSMSKPLSSPNWTAAMASGNNPGNQGRVMSISSPVHFDGAEIGSGYPKRL